MGVLVVGPMVAHALEHVAEHVVAAVRRGAVGAQDHVHARVDELRHGASGDVGGGGAGVVDDDRARLGADADLFVGEAGGVGEKGVGPEDVQRLVGELDGAPGVAVLAEEDTVLPGEVSRRLRLGLEGLQLPAVDGVAGRVVDREHHAGLEPPAGLRRASV